MYFLAFRFAVAGAVVLGLWITLRLRSAKIAVVLVAALGCASWLYTIIPLEQPYGLAPGTTAALEFASVSSGAARGAPLEGWVVGGRNPRPAWSFLWYLLSPGNPTRARRMLEIFPAAALCLLPASVYWLLAAGLRQDPWLASCGAFTATLSATVPLDAFSPFMLFHQGVFFAAPHRSLALVIAVISLGAAWSSGKTKPIVGGVLLGVVAAVDHMVFLWAALALLLAECLVTFRSRDDDRGRVWTALAIGGALGGVVLVTVFGGNETLLRAPTGAEVEAFRIVFRDVFSATTDMVWVFFFAWGAAIHLLYRGSTAGSRMVSMLLASYLLWLGAAVLFQIRPFSEPESVFQILRFSTALVGGVGAFEIARRFSGRIAHLVAVRRPLGGLKAGPLTFACLVVFLLPYSAPFLWRPMMIDPLYYQSTYPWDPSVVRLERWLLQNTEPDEIVLTGDETGEWVASLTGRRVFKADGLMLREEARRRRREIRRLFLSGNREEMRRAVETIGASVLVLDPSLRAVYWEFDETLLVSSALFEKAHQIGDRYAIYRAN